MVSPITGRIKKHELGSHSREIEDEASICQSVSKVTYLLDIVIATYQYLSDISNYYLELALRKYIHILVRFSFRLFKPLVDSDQYIASIDESCKNESLYMYIILLTSI